MGFAARWRLGRGRAAAARQFATDSIAAKPVKPCDGGVFGAFCLLLKTEQSAPGPGWRRPKKRLTQQRQAHGSHAARRMPAAAFSVCRRGFRRASRHAFRRDGLCRRMPCGGRAWGRARGRGRARFAGQKPFAARR